MNTRARLGRRVAMRRAFFSSWRRWPCGSQGAAASGGAHAAKPALARASAQVLGGLGGPVIGGTLGMAELLTILSRLPATGLVRAVDACGGARHALPLWRAAAIGAPVAWHRRWRASLPTRPGSAWRGCRFVVHLAADYRIWASPAMTGTMSRGRALCSSGAGSGREAVVHCSMWRHWAGRWTPGRRPTP